MAGKKEVYMSVSDVVADLRMTQLKTFAKSADVIEKAMPKAAVDTEVQKRLTYKHPSLAAPYGKKP